jgi:hypothetical protein
VSASAPGDPKSVACRGLSVFEVFVQFRVTPSSYILQYIIIIIILIMVIIIIISTSGFI